MREAVIVDAVRTPVGRYGGALRSVRPDDLAALIIQSLVRRNNLDPAAIDDVIFGCANQAGEDNRNVARMAVLLSGLPPTVPGQTVNRLCGSGLQAAVTAAHTIQVGEGEVLIAGGVESMTRAPLVMPKPNEGFPRGDVRVYDTTLGWRFINPRLAEMYAPYSMGETAENVAERYKISRGEQDAFALESQRKAVAAIASGRFKEEIVPVRIPQPRGEPVEVDTDEHPRPDTTAAGLATLEPAFRTGGTVTAGNSSGINDGAAGLLVMEAERAKAMGRAPKARVVATAVAGVDPSVMGLGPVPATRKALARAGLTVGDMDVIELNEAFAAQVLACARDLDLPMERLNPNGGAVALGHPIGCSGARILTSLVYELNRRGGRYGLATMCIGVGQGIAMIVERQA
jgi:3-oxoadipyl-CoA thiolase